MKENSVRFHQPQSADARQKKIERKAKGREGKRNRYIEDALIQSHEADKKRVLTLAAC